MKKKYQVFISSTYQDLIQERAAVSQTLLDMECIPVGMEQFPASGMSQMDYIKRMLDDSDYYILISAGKYGSLDDDGVGFTEKEYDYAKEIGLPVMSFLYKELETLPVNLSESESEKKELLQSFRNKVSKSALVKFYSSKEELKSMVAVSVGKIMIDFPRPGWIRANDDLGTQSLDDDQIKRVLSENTLTKEDIDQLFSDNIQKLPRSTIEVALNDSQGNTLYIGEIINGYTNEAVRGVFSFNYSDNNGKFTIGSGEYQFETKWSKASDTSIHAYSDAASIDAIARIKGPLNIDDDFSGKYNFSSRSRTPVVGDAILWRNKNGNYAVTKVLEIKDDSRGDNEDMLKCEYNILGISSERKLQKNTFKSRHF